MNLSDQNIEHLLRDLKERSRELSCLYRVQEVINHPDMSIPDVFHEMMNAIPQGWQYPEICKAQLEWSGDIFHTPGFKNTCWKQEADIHLRDDVVGRLTVVYLEERPEADEGPFLKEERKLLNSIAEQVGFFLLHHKLKELFNQGEGGKTTAEDWRIILDLLKQSDTGLLRRVCRKMITYLGWHGAPEVEHLLEEFYPGGSRSMTEDNRPFQVKTAYNLSKISNEIFSIADLYFSSETILDLLKKWIREEQSGFLVDVLVNPASTTTDITSALERYRLLSAQGVELTKPRERWLCTSLIRNVLSDQSLFLSVARRYLRIEDFSEFMQRVIFPVGSRGKLGGKGSGLFLATHILEKMAADNELLRGIKAPKTWYLTSDGFSVFMSYNNMGDVTEQKYKDLSQIRQEFPYISHTFKSSPLPPEIVKGLSLALNDFGDVPLIVRSSSLLEDQTNASFAGKYKSFFIANQGSKEERLNALMDAILEVYASLFAPDPIEYRIQHGLDDYEEEMGVMIQEVVGKRIGDYYFPAFAGVAFSSNEFRWSSRIKREDGLVRIVPGLGTRAVDRVSDDYPILVTPGQPGLRVNLSPQEIIYYSPKYIDVINLKEGKFETVEVRQLIKQIGRQYPIVNQVVSTISEDHIQIPSSLMLDFDNDHFAVTFEGLFTRTPFLKQMQAITRALQEAYGYPIDVEFAHDGTDLYLLQCRTQSRAEDTSPAPIPRGLPPQKVIFSANRFISNGRVPEIKYIVYVDPNRYDGITNFQDLLAIGKAVGRLNQVLPKRQFILIGPGRWGSRGDIKLGVSVTYSDINNTTMLVEVARQKKDYVPELSFGTHFFQDLVEASIRYLPLYPDNPGVVFNERFFCEEKNILADLLPDFGYLSDVLRVIDVPAVANGQILRIAMNSDEEQALAYLAEPTETAEMGEKYRQVLQPNSARKANDKDWVWRLKAAENIAAHLDAARYGVKGFYVFGSTKNATAGPQSDIDILVHFGGDEAQRSELSAWLEGWSLSLSEINFLLTGMKTRGGILDVHIVTDEDIKNRTSYAIKIGATTDAARPLPMGEALKK